MRTRVLDLAMLLEMVMLHNGTHSSTAPSPRLQEMQIKTGWMHFWKRINAFLAAASLGVERQ